MIEKITLIGERTMLRPYRPQDVSCSFEAVRESIAEVSPWMPWCYDGYSLEDSREFVESRDEAWAKGESYDFAITDRSDGSYLGGCGLNHINTIERFANLGYWVRSSRTRHGVATAATLSLARFGFEMLNLNRIEIVVAVGNAASQRVAAKSGAVREGVLRRRLVVRDHVYDAVMFSLISEDIRG